MRRVVMWSPALVAVALSPALLQAGTCSPKSGNPDLLSLEIEAGGLDRLVGFDTDTLAYSVWLDGAATFIVRATAEDSNTAIGVWPTGDVADYVLLGNGSGETTIDTPADGTTIIVQTKSTGGIYKSFQITINPPCTADECNDNNWCSSDVCNANVCQFTAVADGTSCYCGGTCTAGLCSISTCVTKTIPMVCDDLSLHSPPIPYPAAFELAVEPLSPVIAGQPFDVHITGYAGVSELVIGFLGAQVELIPSRVAILSGNVDVAVRSGASGSSAFLSPAPISFSCVLDDNGNFGPGAGPYPSCDRVNDIPLTSTLPTGLPQNSDCLVQGQLVPDNPCLPFVELNLIDGTGDACTACTALGLAQGHLCDTAGYCLTIDNVDRAFPLTTAVKTYVADADAAEVLFGFSPFEFLVAGPGTGLVWAIQFEDDPTLINGVVAAFTFEYEMAQWAINLVPYYFQMSPVPDEDLFSIGVVECVTDADCDDGTICTVDSCDPDSSCINSPEAAGLDCSSESPPSATCDANGQCVMDPF